MEFALCTKKLEARMARKSKLTLEQKTMLILEGLKGETSISELCAKYGITTAYYYKLRDKFLKGGQKGLNGNKESKEIKKLKKEIKENKEIIGELTIKNEILKKILE